MSFLGNRQSKHEQHEGSYIAYPSLVTILSTTQRVSNAHCPSRASTSYRLLSEIYENGPIKASQKIEENLPGPIGRETWLGDITMVRLM